MKRLAPKVAEWVERVVNVSEPLSGEFLADDKIPETLFPILARMMTEHMPFLQKTAEMFEQWTQENGNAEIPRAVGMASFAIEQIEGQRMAPPFSLWMLQRPLTFYQDLGDADKLAVNDMLSNVVGSPAFKDFMPGPTLVFQDFKLKLG